MKIINQIMNVKYFGNFYRVQLIGVLLFNGICFGQHNVPKETDTLVNNLPTGSSIIFGGNDVDLHYFRWKSNNNLRNDSIKIFSLSPISKRVNKVNGFALGVGHYENKNIKLQTINGLNVEASPLSVALFTISINVPFESLVVGINDNAISNVAFFDDCTATYIRINGLNISSGGFTGGAELRGMQFGLWNTNGKRKLPFFNWQFKK